LTKAQRTRLVLVRCLLVVGGLLSGLVATYVLPHVYAAQAVVVFNLGETFSSKALADTTLTTQTLLITSGEVLQPVVKSTGVPLDYLAHNVTATVVSNTNPGTSDDNVPNSEVINIRVKHPDRASGIVLANAVAQQYLRVANSSDGQLQAQLDKAQRKLANPDAAPDVIVSLQSQISDLQAQLDQNIAHNNLASIAAPAYSIDAPVFPNTLITLGIGVLAGALAAGLVSFMMVGAGQRVKPGSTDKVLGLRRA
jgi:uncharacterized protein involved in exopolysaccharide biosynthesis